jgi:hypothetical protein
MPSNLDTPVELLASVQNEELHTELEDTLERCLAEDTLRGRSMPTGPWNRGQRRHPLGPGPADAPDTGSGRERRELTAPRGDPSPSDLLLVIVVDERAPDCSPSAK